MCIICQTAEEEPSGMIPRFADGRKEEVIMLNTELNKTLSISEQKEKYDTYCKLILGHKSILAWIMKSTMREYRDSSIDEIQELIEGTPEIGSVRVNPGETNSKPERITGISSEDNVPNEGIIYYDIRYYAYLPGSEDKAKVIINVEAQKKFNPGYSILTRGIFYAARMISAQLGTEFEIPHYDDIKKVYSIWVCNDAPRYAGNTIDEYSIQKLPIIPGFPDRKNEYDKMSVILICLNDKVDDRSDITRLLNTVFTDSLSHEAKKDVLEKEYDIPMENDNGIGKELELMCNMSDFIEERAMRKGLQRGMEQGLEQGLEQGIEQGIEQGRLQMVKELILDGSLGDDKILKIAKITPEQLQKIKETIA